MGLFDKIFGKKKADPVPSSAPTPKQEPESPFLISYSTSYDEMEQKIANNPYSSEYRLNIQQKSIELDFLDYLTFCKQSKGRFVALDLETTGFSCHAHKIIEIAAVKVDDGQIIQHYHQYVDPDMHIPSEATAVNHITDDMVKGKPHIYEVLPDLLHFIGDDIIVAHNANFDFQFVAQSCMRHRFRVPPYWFDSMKLCDIWPDLDNRKLQTFLDAAGIENTSAHSASGDAEALAMLMIESMKKEFTIKLPDNFDPGYSVEHFKGTVEQIDDLLSGKRFVVTGEIDGYSRYDFEKLIASHGGKATIKISNATDYLIVGHYDSFPSGYRSAKYEFARNLIDNGGKIQIISPDDFFAMIQ